MSQHQKSNTFCRVLDDPAQFPGYGLAKEGVALVDKKKDKGKVN